MIFQVTEIEFDLDDEDVIANPNLQEQLQEEYVGQIWEADNEDDLVDTISDSTGWCIKSISYKIEDI
jgi:hypothetical protein